MYSLTDHYDEIHGKKLKVIYMSGRETIGDYDGIYSGIEYDSDYDRLALDLGSGKTGIYVTEDEIKDIVVVGERDRPWLD